MEKATEMRKRAREARELPLLSLYYINEERERRRGPGGAGAPREGEGSKEAGMDIPGGLAGRSGSERASFRFFLFITLTKRE